MAYYTLEVILMVIARGLYTNKGSYLRDPNNLLNFIIVVLTLSISYEFIYCFIFRLFTVFTTFTKIPIFMYCEKILKLLKISMEEILSTLFLLMFFLLLFCILGVNLWSESLDSRCRLTEEPKGDIWEVDMEKNYLCGNDYLYPCKEDNYCGSVKYHMESQKIDIDTAYRYIQIPELNYGITNFNNVY